MAKVAFRLPAFAFHASKIADGTMTRAPTAAAIIIRVRLTLNAGARKRPAGHALLAPDPAKAELRTGRANRMARLTDTTPV